VSNCSTQPWNCWSKLFKGFNTEPKEALKSTDGKQEFDFKTKGTSISGPTLPNNKVRAVQKTMKRTNN
jgi:hypothetical protein